VTVADALLLALGAIAAGSGFLVVTSTHLVRAGLYLVVSLGAIAGLYLVLGAELVAWVQVLVYVGAVVVLLLFAVMLTRAPIGASADLDRPAGPAALIGAGVGIGLTALLADAFRWTRYELPRPGTAERIGEQVFGAWVLPFEVLSILLLAALVGAIVLSRPDLGARPDPEASGVPLPPVDPTAEDAEVVARLARIEARQEAAAARRRAQVAAERAAAAEAAVPPPPGSDMRSGGPADPTALKEQARDVIFSAHEREVAAGRATGRLALPGAADPGRPSDDAEATRREDRPALTEGSDRPALSERPGRPALPGRSGTEGAERPALPASADDETGGKDA
jgi:NADH-quinone oxidoreductase subunit J